MTILQKMFRRKKMLEVAAKGRTQVDEDIKNGIFPPGTPLSDDGRAIAWFEEELVQWQMWRKAVRDNDPNLAQIEAGISWLRKPTGQALSKSAAPPKRKNVAA